MTITPERLAELRKQIGDNIGPYRFFVPTNVDEFRDLLDAADNLAALLAAAECYEEYQEATWAQVRTSFREKFSVPDGVDTEVWARSMWTAAIRRARGEQP